MDIMINYDVCPLLLHETGFMSGAGDQPQPINKGLLCILLDTQAMGAWRPNHGVVNLGYRAVRKGCVGRVKGWLLEGVERFSISWFLA